MNLILQGLNTDRPTINRIATMADAQCIVQINAHAYRCEGVLHTDALKAHIDGECFANKLDYAFVESGRKLSDFKLVTMDMDSTLITIECIDEIADMQGLKPQVAEITEAAMRG
jgi:phosphoserine phosphatase